MALNCCLTPATRYLSYYRPFVLVKIDLEEPTEDNLACYEVTTKLHVQVENDLRNMFQAKQRDTLPP